MSARSFASAVVLVVLAATVATAVADDRFIYNGDGTVTDTKLSVMWSEFDNQGDIDRREAEQWVRFTFPDTLATQYDNWRMPTVEELKSLYVDDPGYKGFKTDCGQQVKITPFIRLSCGWVWADEIRSITAGLYNFSRGHSYLDRMVKYRGYRALPVRDLK